MSYFAELDGNGNVIRVIVADSIEWPQQKLGGNWIETQYDDSVEQYAGIGFYHDESSQWKFAPPWVQPTGSEDAYSLGSYVAHNGQIWTSKLPANVWEPGVAGWRDPISEIPQWQQPTGSVDAYELDAKVFHNDKEWQSNVPANVWEPGAVGITQWDDITESPPDVIEDWVQPTGEQDAYRLGAIVRHKGQIWVNTGSDANVWEPGVFGWTLQE